MALYKKFPTYRQLDQMDCGPTCIKMLADYYRTNATWTGIREWLETQRKESITLMDLAQALEHHGMTARWMLLPLRALTRKGATPLIVPWSKNHFMIIYKIGRRKIYLIDPAQGRKAISRLSFGQYWSPNGTGIALAITKKAPTSQKPRFPWAALYLPLIIPQQPQKA